MRGDREQSSINRIKRFLFCDKMQQPYVYQNKDVYELTDDELEVNFTFITEPEVKLGEYKNLKVNVGVPKEFEGQEVVEIKEAQPRNIQKSMELGTISKLLSSIGINRNSQP